MILKVFIVEDSEIIKHRIVRLLSIIEGIEISGSSEDLDDAFESIKTLKPDVIVLDISVEKTKGLNMIKQIKNINPDSTVIMFTNYVFDEYKKRSFEFGADFYLDKSIEFDKLPQILVDLKKKHESVFLVQCM